MASFGALVPRIWVYGVSPLTPYTQAATDTLILDHPTRSKFNGTLKFSTEDQGDAIADISCFVTRCQITTGKTNSLSSFGGGRMTLELDSSDRRFDSFARGHAFNVNGPNLFRPGRRIRCVLVNPVTPTVPEFWLWSGFVSARGTTYSAVAAAQTDTASIYRTTVDCTDAFDRLAAVDRPEQPLQGAGELAEQRVRRILDTAAWAQGPVRYRHGYGYRVQGGAGRRPLQATNLAQDCLTTAKLAAASEGGQLYVDRDGSIVMQTSGWRDDLRFTQPQWWFGGAGGWGVGQWGVGQWGVDAALARTWAAPDNVVFDHPSRGRFNGLYRFNGVGKVEGIGVYERAWSVPDAAIPYEAPVMADDRAELVTRVTVAVVGGKQRELVDTEAEGAAGGPATWTRTDLICRSTDDALAVGQQVLDAHRDVTARIVGLTVRPYMSQSAMAFAALAGFGDRCQVRNWGAAAMTRRPWLVGMRHTITPDDWFVDVDLAEAY